MAERSDSFSGAFGERVCALVRRIPRGKVLTYGRVAMLLGVPHGARAVGWALHGTPAEGDVPWHRVVNAAGRISVRCDEHSALVQRQRLEAEGVIFDEIDPLKIRDFNAIIWSPSPLECYECGMGNESGQP